MAVKKYTLAVSFAIFYILQVSDAKIEPVVKTYTATLSHDFTIPWTFDNEADIDTVDWIYQSSPSATTTTIMSKAGTAAAQVNNNYNVEHVSNGEITLKTVTLNNTGIYFCEVAYTLASGNTDVTGTATLSVTAPTPVIWRITVLNVTNYYRLVNITCPLEALEDPNEFPTWWGPRSITKPLNEPFQKYFTSGYRLKWIDSKTIMIWRTSNYMSGTYTCEDRSGNKASTVVRVMCVGTEDAE